MCWACLKLDGIWGFAREQLLELGAALRGLYGCCIEEDDRRRVDAGRRDSGPVRPRDRLARVWDGAANIDTYLSGSAAVLPNWTHCLGDRYQAVA